ncbi:MAG: hypothetical protein Q7R64_00655 [bacterium]|nr:hypothetical protein [bacterium]
MYRNKLLNFVAFLGVFLTALHTSALVFALYWRWWWFDLLTHFLGGVFVALLLLWFFFFSGYTRVPAPRQSVLFLALVGGTLLIGVGWEAFESVVGLTWSPEGYWFDTIVDVCMDFIGALLVYVCTAKRAQRLLTSESIISL